VVIALIVTPDGFPLGYEVLPGNTADCTTLRDMLRRIEAQYGKANRVWVMDRGIPTEEVLAEMRAADPPVSYLVVGTPKGRLSKLEKHLITLPWQAVREGVDVKLLPQDQEPYVLAQSHARIDKERAMRRGEVVSSILPKSPEKQTKSSNYHSASAGRFRAWKFVPTLHPPKGGTRYCLAPQQRFALSRSRRRPTPLRRPMAQTPPPRKRHRSYDQATYATMVIAKQ
jgi:hypothetical protein